MVRLDINNIEARRRKTKSDPKKEKRDKPETSKKDYRKRKRKVRHGKKINK